MFFENTFKPVNLMPTQPRLRCTDGLMYLAVNKALNIKQNFK